MLAEQVGGHTPTLEGFHWRHDALFLTKVVGWQWARSVGCLCMKCQSVIHKQSTGCSRYVFRHSIWIGVYITRRQPWRFSTDTLWQARISLPPTPSFLWDSGCCTFRQWLSCWCWRRQLFSLFRWVIRFQPRVQRKKFFFFFPPKPNTFVTIPS